jgi:alpha-N-arabinofuranosidase
VLAFSRANIWAKDTDARIEVLLDEPLGEISPNLYGQFTEHIGGVIYDGVWVGEKSKITNQYGIRSQLVDNDEADSCTYHSLARRLLRG